MTAAAETLPGLLRSFFAPEPPARLGVAVSGGGDSLALLHLLDIWRREGGPDLSVVTVDHGLRPEAQAEAALVGRVAAGMGLPHAILRWQGWDGQGNLPDRARRARYALIADWAAGAGIGTVALGHTADDQAETFLMRLARGSGVDGLSAMAARRIDRGVAFVRPLLAARRADLRDWLREQGADWVEDPTNDDLAFGRVRARQALALLAPLGITVDGLVATASRMRMAREALSAAAVALARDSVRIEAGDVVILRVPFEAAPYETRARLLAHALIWVASADYRPRFSALAAAYQALAANRRATLHGCLALPTKRTFRITREVAAVAGRETPAGTVWDSRWRLSGPGDGGLTIRALGAAGLSRCPDWRATRLPRPTLLASPAVWRGAELVAAPLTGLANGWRAEPVRADEAFFASLAAAG